MSSMEATKSRRRRNLESSILIWLTNNMNEIKLNQLRKIIDYVEIFDDIDACNQYIERIEDDDRIYVVTEIPYVSNKARVYFYEARDNFNTAIQEIETDYKTQLNPMGINIFKQSTHSPLNSEFLWFQRILNVLIDTEDREKAKTHFIDAYKRYYDGNRQKEEKIRQFEDTYRSENALQWYSRECFFFDILNKALRTQDIDVLFSLRFFLKDIYDQLKLQYEKTSHEIDMIVYRGQTISAIELQIIRENIGQLISLNSFVSTTLEHSMATAFSLSGNPSGEHILFHIKVDKSIVNPKPFANISTVSQFAEEKEVLFMAGSIFEIKNANFCESSTMWIIELHLCDDNDYELNDVYQEDKTIVSNQKSPFSFAAVLLRMNLFDKAEKYYQRLLDDGSMTDASSNELITNCYWGLSNVARKRGDLDIALAYSRLAIEKSQDQPELLFHSYKYIAFNYLDIHSISEALEYQMKALEIQREINDSNDQIADTLFNIGFIHFSPIRPKIDFALDYFSQALNIYKKMNIYDHIIRCYNAIGEVYRKNNQKELALNYFLQALQVIDTHYPSYLPYRIDSFEHIAEAYVSMRDYVQAIKYYNNVLNEKIKYEPFNDPTIAQSYERIGGVYHKQGDIKTAIEMYTKAIEIRRRVQPESHQDIESIVSMRDSLQEFIENHPEEIIDYDLSSDDEHTFDSMQEAFDYCRTQMDTEQKEH